MPAGRPGGRAAAATSFAFRGEWRVGPARRGGPARRVLLGRGRGGVRLLEPGHRAVGAAAGAVGVPLDRADRHDAGQRGGGGAGPGGSRGGERGAPQRQRVVRRARRRHGRPRQGRQALARRPRRRPRPAGRGARGGGGRRESGRAGWRRLPPAVDPERDGPAAHPREP